MKIYNLVSGKLSNSGLCDFYTSGHDTVMWHWSVDAFFWQLSIDHVMDLSYQITKMWAACIYKLTQFDLWTWPVSCIYLGAVLRDSSGQINILRDYFWARDMVMWHWSAGFLYWQLSIDMNI